LRSAEAIEEMSEAKTSSSEVDGAPCVITSEDGFEDDPDLSNVVKHLEDEERVEVEREVTLKFMQCSYNIQG
jgi:hypothetical protein